MSILHIPFDNAYARLPSHFYARCIPTAVSAPRLIRFNDALAGHLGIDAHDVAPEALAAMFAGNVLPEGSEPLAMAYCGHQFGHLNPQLGDGRALLLGDVIDREGCRRDIQLKGAGRTPFSRGGDGRSPLGPVLREYVMCEAMHALGVPTTRALAAVWSGDPVIRETVEPGAVFTRVAASHIRIGTFQYFAIRDDETALRLLADHVIARHYPGIDPAAPTRYLQLLEGVCQRQAALVAQWMTLGFIHGVMNTDNMTVSGETIDYGPCAFIDEYRSDAVFSFIDRDGRYAFSRQPSIAQWNLSRFAETLLGLMDDNEDAAVQAAMAVLGAFPAWFENEWLAGMRRKLGLVSNDPDDIGLIRDGLAWLQASRADYTLFFRGLAALVGGDEGAALCEAFPVPANDTGSPLSHPWLARWQARVNRESLPVADRAARMRAVNPAVIPRNHYVAAVIRAAETEGSLAPFEALLAAVTRPYEDGPAQAPFRYGPTPEERVCNTFCGT